jgi:hypothetical protein
VIVDVETAQADALWLVEPENRQQQLLAEFVSILDVTVSPCGRLIAVCCVDGTVRLLKLPGSGLRMTPPSPVKDGANGRSKSPRENGDS